jgi:hypothetical protein
VGGKVFCYNVDISACDSSNRHLVFGTVGLALSNFNKERALGLVSQCCGLIRVDNPSNPLERVDIDVLGPFEGSGSVLTTVLNFVASEAIVSGFFFLLSKADLEQVSLEDLIIRGALNSGHKVSTQDCCVDRRLVPEKIQFLKYSPMMTTEGKYIPVRNIACLLRSWGRVEGGLTAASLNVISAAFLMMTHQERFDMYASNIIKSQVHEPNMPILTAFRERYLQSKGVFPCKIETVMEDQKQVTASYSDQTITLESFCARYDLTQAELQVLIDQVTTSRVFVESASVACTKIFKVDYDLDI